MTQPLGPATRLARNDEIVASDLDGEIVMMSIASGAYYTLDETGSAVWEILEAPRTVAETVEALTREFEVDGEQCLRDTLPFLQRMVDEGILRQVG